jgi:hypothetical protein
MFERSRGVSCQKLYTLSKLCGRLVVNGKSWLYKGMRQNTVKGGDLLNQYDDICSSGYINHACQNYLLDLVNTGCLRRVRQRLCARLRGEALVSKNLTVLGCVQITVSPIQVFMKISPIPLSIKKFF